MVLDEGQRELGLAEQLEPRFITAELTFAYVKPELAELRPFAAESLANAHAEIDALWVPVGAAS